MRYENQCCFIKHLGFNKFNMMRTNHDYSMKAFLFLGYSGKPKLGSNKASVGWIIPHTHVSGIICRNCTIDSEHETEERDARSPARISFNVQGDLSLTHFKCSKAIGISLASAKYFNKIKCDSVPPISGLRLQINFEAVIRCPAFKILKINIQLLITLACNI